MEKFKGKNILLFTLGAYVLVGISVIILDTMLYRLVVFPYATIAVIPVIYSLISYLRNNKYNYSKKYIYYNVLLIFLLVFSIIIAPNYTYAQAVNEVINKEYLDTNYEIVQLRFNEQTVHLSDFNLKINKYYVILIKADNKTHVYTVSPIDLTYIREVK